jgi:hypothetical protein
MTIMMMIDAGLGTPLKRNKLRWCAQDDEQQDDDNKLRWCAQDDDQQDDDNKLRWCAQDDDQQ